MTNELLDAANSNEKDKETSKERFEKLKQEKMNKEDNDPAKKRFEKLKQKKKEELRRNEGNDENKVETDEKDGNKFITY